MSQPGKRKKVKRILTILIILITIGFGTFFILPEDGRTRLLELIGIKYADYEVQNEFESFVAVRNISARQAALGDDWIIKGKIFNTHQTKDLTTVTLMFNFSDGVEVKSYIELIRPGNTVGRKFKERFSGHGRAQFNSITVLEAN